MQYVYIQQLFLYLYQSVSSAVSEKRDVSLRRLGDTSTQSDTDSPKMILFHDTSPQHMANTHLSHSFPSGGIMFAAGRILLRLPHLDTYHCAVFCLQDTG